MEIRGAQPRVRDAQRRANASGIAAWRQRPGRDLQKEDRRCGDGTTSPRQAAPLQAVPASQSPDRDAREHMPFRVLGIDPQEDVVRRVAHLVFQHDPDRRVRRVVGVEQAGRHVGGAAAADADHARIVVRQRARVGQVHLAPRIENAQPAIAGRRWRADACHLGRLAAGIVGRRRETGDVIAARRQRDDAGREVAADRVAAPRVAIGEDARIEARNHRFGVGRELGEYGVVGGHGGGLFRKAKTGLWRESREPAKRRAATGATRLRSRKARQEAREQTSGDDAVEDELAGRAVGFEPVSELNGR